MPANSTIEVKVVVDTDEAIRKIERLQEMVAELQAIHPIQISLRLDGKQIADSVAERGEARRQR